ncbi:hypothetical protein ZWY2020_009996 [Hordeum vulgare]|nr:hypothetical protein ZWY2020_009996 [Hordeum vulgare]
MNKPNLSKSSSDGYTTISMKASTTQLIDRCAPPPTAAKPANRRPPPLHDARAIRDRLQEDKMLWRTIRSMEVMAHSSNFLLPKLHQPAKTPANNYTLVVLNQQLPRFMPRLWAQAKMRICADGGANRVFDEMSQMKNDLDRNRYIPEIIEGDMDSIRPEVKRFYSSQGSKISDKSHNQETTDLHKCISSIRHRTPDHEKPNLCVLVTGALGGSSALVQCSCVHAHKLYLINKGYLVACG